MCLQGLVYEKLLRLSRWNFSSGNMTYGEAISHMTMDPYHLMMTVFMIHQFWTLPLRVCIQNILAVLYSLWLFLPVWPVKFVPLVFTSSLNLCFVIYIQQLSEIH